MFISTRITTTPATATTATALHATATPGSVLRLAVTTRDALRRGMAGVLCAGAIAMSAGAAQSATVSVEAVSGVWDVVDPANTVKLNGQGTNKIAWGTGAKQGGYRQSGYSFDGIAESTPVSEGTVFNLGTFTHLNWAILTTPEPSSINGASLRVVFDLLIDGVSQSLVQVYDFTHWETPNTGIDGVCADGGAPGAGVNAAGCADRVQATVNDALSDTVIVDGVEYTIDISGFQGFDVDGTGIPTFWTRENQENEAILQGVFHVAGTPPPPVVPLPAAGWALVAALGALGAARRRRH